MHVSRLTLLQHGFLSLILAVPLVMKKNEGRKGANDIPKAFARAQHGPSQRLIN